MTSSENYQVVSGSSPIRERVGLAIDGANAAAAVKTIVAAEDAGVRQIWMVQPPNLPDTLTTFSAAAAKTSTVKLGTSIVPTYPRHPLVLAQQALAIHDLAPGRLRLGIGPSHRFIIENIYGLQHSKPLAHLREYLEVLWYCTLGWESRSSWRILSRGSHYAANGSDTSVNFNTWKDGFSISRTNSRWGDIMGMSCSISA